MSYGYNSNYGKVARLYSTHGRTFFRLKGGQTAMNPTGGYYFVPTSHDNYNALVALLYMAANVGYTIYVRTKETLVDGHAEVYYFVVDW